MLVFFHLLWLSLMKVRCEMSEVCPLQMAFHDHWVPCLVAVCSDWTPAHLSLLAGALELGGRKKEAGPLLFC